MLTPLTTTELIEGIIQTQVGFDLTPFINMATQIVTDVCIYPTNPYTPDKLTMIATWLAAHFYTIYDNQLARAKAGSVSVGYMYKIDYGFKNSMYGQQAMRLDNQGGLAGLDNVTNVRRTINAGIMWLGKRQDGPRCLDSYVSCLASPEG